MTARAIASSPGRGASPQRNAIHFGRPAPVLVKPASGKTERKKIPQPALFTSGSMFGAEGPAALWGNLFSTALCWQSCAIDMYREMFCLFPWQTAYFEVANRAIASCTEHAMNSFGVPPINLLHAPETCPGVEAAVPPDVLERSMDVAIGLRAR